MRRLAVFLLAVGVGVVVCAPAASAHPLGNFTVNHYDGLRIGRTRITDHAVVDSAEIPTAQAGNAVDADGDGRASPAERKRYAAGQCDALARVASLTVSGRRARFVAETAAFVYRTGVAGLDVSRLTCELSAPVRITRFDTVVFQNHFAEERVGWHEITAVGDGVTLHDSPVPAKSVSNELRRYPNDLLSSPLDVRRVRVEVRPGFGASTFAPGVGGASHVGLATRVLENMNRTFDSLVGTRHLTPVIAAMAIALALLLGAAHALLPGHGKTVMAAYIAGRQGSVRDAFVVGATVTATHTLGVFALGVALSVSASLAGEAVLQWLGVTSGLIVIAVGAGLLIGALRQRGVARAALVAEQEHVLAHANAHAHAHAHAHEHEHDGAHRHGLFAHTHEPDALRQTSRRGLIGMGIAGGLVPSPSALVILLAAIALGRALFGVVLVLSYGLGMAATLTAAGLLLVVVRDKYRARPGRQSRLAGAGQRWIAFLPVGTACLVMGMGALLATRGLGVV